MNALTIGATSAKTMTSREIADLTGKEIGHIHRDIRAMLEQLGDDPELNHVREDKDGRGYTTCFHMPKGLTMTLVAGYNAKLRKAIIDRWQQLEQQAAQGFAIPQSMGEALRLAADEHDKRVAAESALALAAPKAEALDRIARADGSLCITSAAKDLQVRPKDLFAWLQAHQWIYRRPGGASWLGYQDRIQQGLLEHKVTTVSSSDGSEKVVEQVRITPKGLTKLAQVLDQRKAA